MDVASSRERISHQEVERHGRIDRVVMGGEVVVMSGVFQAPFTRLNVGNLNIYVLQMSWQPVEPDASLSTKQK